MKIVVDGKSANLDKVWSVGHLNAPVELSPEAREKMSLSRKYIESRIQTGDTMYGVNTGFGLFSDVRISPSQIRELQQNLIRSHSCGVGDPFTPPQSRAIMYLRANCLATGHSGIRPEVVDKILEFLNCDIIPVIPQKGSVGASGDLAPLSHLALALIGEGEVWYKGKRESAEQALSKTNVQPLVLEAKEGLSLINGCQVMTAIGLLNAYRARQLVWMADIAGAITLEGLKGSRRAFDPIISAVRPHPGEAKTARNLLKILGDSSVISKSHENCSRVQDAYSLRCMPAVHGAAKKTLRDSVETLEIEANSSTDNPLVFAQENKILSCGNFHGEPVAFTLDFLAIALSAMASMSECRIEKLINPSMSNLPPFLASDGGLHSGHMIVQVAAASLVSENKILSHPASVDSIPTSADKEDHVSMGTIAARKLGEVVSNAELIFAMELLSGTQALDLLKPLEPEAGVKAAFDKVRELVPFAKKDRVFAKDIETIKNMIERDEILQSVTKTVGELEW